MILIVLQTIFILIVLLAIVFFIYIRIKFRFWALQPVFHFYDLYYWIANIGIIQEELPSKNRYTNFKNIKTISYDILSEKNIKDFIWLVQLNYLRNKDNTFTPKQNNILPYFQGHNHKAFWSFYYEPTLLLDSKTNTAISDEKLIAVITGRPLHVTFYNNKNNKNTKNNNKNNNKIKGELDVYYIDYLCVDKLHRKKNIAPQLIQTHEYNQSHLNRKICVSLFKREEELTGIIPLTVYKTYCFNMRNWNKPPDLNANIQLLNGDKQNIYYLYNFINELTKQGKWELTVLPTMSNLMKLVATENLFIKMLVSNGDLVATYIFKKTCTFIEKDKEIISCIASFFYPNFLTKDIFIQGFKVALWSIIEKKSKGKDKDKENDKNKFSIFSYLVVEDISDNHYIIENIKIKTHPLVVSPTAYFFYNFAYNPFKSARILIVN
jgi:hypothetical protein